MLNYQRVTWDNPTHKKKHGSRDQQGKMRLQSDMIVQDRIETDCNWRGERCSLGLQELERFVLLSLLPMHFSSSPRDHTGFAHDPWDLHISPFGPRFFPGSQRFCCAKDDADEVSEPRQDREAQCSILWREHPQSHSVDLAFTRLNTGEREDSESIRYKKGAAEV